MLICLCVAKALLLVVIVVVFRVLRHKYGAYSLTVKCLLTNSDRIVLPICLKFTFSHSLFRDVWHVFVCVYVCVVVLFIFVIYVFKDKKKTIYFFTSILNQTFRLFRCTHNRDQLSFRVIALSLSFCFLFRFVVISGFAQSLDLCFTYALSWGTFSTRISTIFTHNSRIFGCYCDASRTPQRFPLHHVFFILLFLPLSLFCCIFFNTRFAHVDVSFAVVVCFFAVFNSLIC